MQQVHLLIGGRWGEVFWIEGHDHADGMEGWFNNRDYLCVWRGQGTEQVYIRRQEEPVPAGLAQNAVCEVTYFFTNSGSITKDDFSIYKYSHKLNKESLILNIQVSSDHKYVLLGFEFGDIFLFHYNELFTIDPIKSEAEPLSNVYNLPIRHHLRYHCDEIRELKWHQNNEYFVSGGKEGYCLLWEYKN